MKQFFRLMPVAVLAVLLSGCGSWSKKPGEPGGEGGAQTSGYSGNGADGGRYGSGYGNGDPLSQRVIYFEYDSSEIRAEFKPVVRAHAEKLRASGGRITLEGHSDERGSREYNIALGERRAQSVRQLMMSAGLSGSQIRTISYGEERPVVRGADGQSMAQNRRVELNY